MDTTLTPRTHIAGTHMAEKDKRIAEAVHRERARLGNFIRQRVPDPAEAEDILQDVFYEFVEAYRLPEPIEQVGAWLYRVARNRIIDRFRKKKEAPLAQLANGQMADGEEEQHWLEEILPDAANGPEAEYSRRILLDEIQAALAELPAEQRDAFIGHEIEGKSFQQMADDTRTPISTLLARKRYAVRHLQARLKDIYEEFKD